MSKLSQHSKISKGSEIRSGTGPSKSNFSGSKFGGKNSKVEPIDTEQDKDDNFLLDDMFVDHE